MLKTLFEKIGSKLHLCKHGKTEPKAAVKRLVNHEIQ